MFDGDAVPAELMASGKFDLGAWIGKHNQEVTRPYIDAALKELKSQGITSFAATGYVRHFILLPVVASNRELTRMKRTVLRRTLRR